MKHAKTYWYYYYWFLIKFFLECIHIWIVVFQYKVMSINTQVNSIFLSCYHPLDYLGLLYNQEKTKKILDESLRDLTHAGIAIL